MWSVIFFLLLLDIDISLVKRDPTKPWLEVSASPRISMALVGPGQHSRVRVVAEIKGPEDESYYCPEVAFISGLGTLYHQESVEATDCVPYEQRHVVPPTPPECRPYLKAGRIYRPACADDVREAQGFPRRWSRTYSVGPCETDDEFASCSYTIVVELRRHVESDSPKDPHRSDVRIAQQSVRFWVK